MKKLCFALLAAVAVAAVGTSQANANLLANPGFEDPVTMDGAPFVGFWEAFSGGAGATSANGNISPRSGLQELDLGIDNTNNTFAGAFQDVPNLVAGWPVTFSGWHKTITDPFDVGVEIRIEWRNTAGNNEVSRTPNLVLVPTADYTQFSLPSIVPAGADTARVVYAIQSFGPEPTNTGFVLLDDMSFVVPEPATAALFGLATLGLACIYRRRG